MATAEVNIPTAIQFLDSNGYVSTPWRLWLLSPRVQSIETATPIDPASGGTGSSTVPLDGYVLIGVGDVYVPSLRLPVSAFPGLTGDVGAAAGSIATALVSVNADIGTWGTGTAVASFTVNGKGLVTAASNVAITGAPGDFAVVGDLTSDGGFGCNGSAAQSSATLNAAISATAGAAYTAAEQGMLNDLKAIVNQMRAALVANGIAV